MKKEELEKYNEGISKKKDSKLARDKLIEAIQCNENELLESEIYREATKIILEAKKHPTGTIQRSISMKRYVEPYWLRIPAQHRSRVVSQCIVYYASEGKLTLEELENAIRDVNKSSKLRNNGNKEAEANG